jgi:hypothetical protein
MTDLSNATFAEPSIKEKKKPIPREKHSRAVKDTSSGLFNETKLSERVVKSPKPITSPIASRDRSPKAVQQPATIDPMDPYALIRIDQNENDENVICDICLDSDDEEGDEIVICEMCLVGVH